MSNLEASPQELACESRPDRVVQILEAREVPLGGPRAMTVRRTLPQRARSLIGAWCFVDHYGPDDVSTGVGMRVPGHPHTGLQTVSWLFRGEIEHRDTTGTHAMVRPGELNVMTAGTGIAHSEFSTPDTSILHGVQLWIALPAEHRYTEPAFHHYVPPIVERDGVRAAVFLGSLFGQTSPVEMFSPLVGAEIIVPAGSTANLDVDVTFEHGVLVDTGEVTVSGIASTTGQLIYHEPGVETITVHASADVDARVLLLGGEPLNERIIMWWNLIGRSHEEIVQFRTEWEQARRDNSAATRYGAFPAEWESTLPAPELPNTRLQPRE